MGWTVETLAPVDVEIAALPPGLRARILRLLKVIDSFGLDQLREPHAKHLEGKLWELRAKAGEGIALALYVTMTGQRVVVLHVFEKKTQKTPRRAIEIALDRMKRMM